MSCFNLLVYTGLCNTARSYLFNFGSIDEKYDIILP